MFLYRTDRTSHYNLQDRLCDEVLTSITVTINAFFNWVWSKLSFATDFESWNENI